MEVGIAISTYNRQDAFNQTLENVKKFAPEGAKIVVVDDGSDNPVKSDYRFDKNVGIARAKNKCIELLMHAGCEHLFLFDDDCYPKTKNWHLPYINSREPHMSFTFDHLCNGRANGRQALKKENGHCVYRKPCGPMLYIDRRVVEKVGGFDINFAKWGYEHVNYSDRVYNNGLTSERYMDVSNSLDLFHSCDYYCQFQSSVNSYYRRVLIPDNKIRYVKNISSNTYYDYKENNRRGVVIASYFTGLPDPQRGLKWDSDVSKLDALIDSCKEHGVDYRIFHDCFDVKDKNFIKVDSPKEFTPNVYRWLVYRDYLDTLDYEAYFFVDSTDVELLQNPFGAMTDNALYVGCEHGNKFLNTWLRKRQEPFLRIKDYRKVKTPHMHEMLLNCGIVGGDAEIISQYINIIADTHEMHSRGLKQSVDMATFNYVCWKYFKNQLCYGVRVNTQFKNNERNDISFFKHK